MSMKSVLGFALVALFGATVAASAASITNNDSDTITLLVTEDGVRSELVIGAGETVVACPDGCFLSTPNGDRAVLDGDEDVSIVNGAALIQ